MMFTIEQIQTAHAKVKSGADFPAYIKDIKTLGVLGYTTYVTDGHAEYEGANNYQTSSPAKYSLLQVNTEVDAVQFRNDLVEHQQGKTGYLQFCEEAAANGVDRWQVDLVNMTCTYLDVAGNNILVEKIPG